MKRLVALAAAVLVAGCGAKPEQRAVDACAKEITTRLSGKSFEIDPKDMLGKVEKPADGVMQINSTVYFDKGLPAETKQTFDCRVQFDPANAAAEPKVTSLNFIW